MRKSKVLLIAILLVAVLATSVYAGGGRDRATQTDTLYVGIAANPVSFDPTQTNDQPSAYIFFHVYETLIAVDYDMSPLPGLAERWVWDNPQNLRLFIRRGVRFHNGDELKASDVKFSLERAALSPHVGNLSNMIERVDIINDYEVVARLTFPFVPFISNLGHTGLSIVNERAVREMGEVEYARNPVGTGPYRFVNAVQGDRVNLTRFDNYWNASDRAKIENLTFRVIVDQSTRLISLETGEINIALNISPNDMSRVRNDPNLTLYHEPTLATNYIAFNASRPPFNDVRVRHAVQHAIDLPAMVQAVYQGALGSTNGPINNRVWSSISDELPPFEYNPARSRQLLAEAGYPNGFSTAFYTNENPQRVDTGEILQNMLREVGIQVDVRIVEWGAFLEMTGRGEADLFMLGWTNSTGDPDRGMFNMFHTSQHGAAGNRGFFSDPEIDRLLDAGRVETDLARRAAIYRDVQWLIRDASPWIFQSAGADIVGARNNVRDLRLHPRGHYKYWRVSFQ